MRRNAGSEATKWTTREREDELQRIVEKAAVIVPVPIAMLSIVGRDRTWISVRQTSKLNDIVPALPSAGQIYLRPGEPLIVLDTALDHRHPVLQNHESTSRVRFFAGIPLVDRGGYVDGALCLIDTAPRSEMPDLTEVFSLARAAERLIMYF
jgi:GAF domain-containing protein